MGDEYLVLTVFFAGTVVQGMLVSRSWSGAGGTLALAAATLGSAWIGARHDEDAAFAVPFMGLFFFVIVLFEGFEADFGQTLGRVRHVL